MITYVLIPISPFCDNWLESYSPLNIARVLQRPSWIVKFPPMGFLGTFSNTLNIFWKNQVVTNLFNVEPNASNGPGLQPHMLSKRITAFRGANCNISWCYWGVYAARKLLQMTPLCGSIVIQWRVNCNNARNILKHWRVNGNKKTGSNVTCVTIVPDETRRV